MENGSMIDLHDVHVIFFVEAEVPCTKWVVEAC